MKRLDDAFCDQLLEKKWIDKSLLTQIQKDTQCITIREKLLLEHAITLSKYITIATALQKDTKLIDNARSLAYDQQFLSYVLKNKLITTKELEIYQKMAEAYCLRVRELLLLTSKISYETYLQVTSKLAQESAAKEPAPEQANSEDSSDKTLIDDDITPRPILKKETSLSLVQDNSAETIIDISPLENPEDVPLISSSTPQKKSDESEETLIDRDLDADHFMSDDPTIDVASPRQVPVAEMPSSEMAVPTQTQDRVVTQAETSYPSEETKTYPEEETPEPRESHAKTAAISALRDTIQRRVSQQRESTQEYQPSEEAAVVMDNLIKEVQNQVYLQTQQITRDVGKEISGYKSFYKIFAAMVIFFSLFLLAFTGLIEFQRFQDLKNLRAEKNEALLQKSQLEKELRDKEVELKILEQQKQFVDDQKQALEKSLEQQKQVFEQQRNFLEQQKAVLEQQKYAFEKKQKELANVNKIWFDTWKLLSSWEYSLAYQSIGEAEKSKDSLDEAQKQFEALMKVADADEILAIRLADCQLRRRSTSEAISLLEPFISKSWLVCWRLGEIYRVYNKDYRATKMYWERALKLNPNLKALEEQIKKLPKS